MERRAVAARLRLSARPASLTSAVVCCPLTNRWLSSTLSTLPTRSARIINQKNRPRNNNGSRSHRPCPNPHIMKMLSFSLTCSGRVLERVSQVASTPQRTRRSPSPINANKLDPRRNNPKRNKTKPRNAYPKSITATPITKSTILGIRRLRIFLRRLVRCICLSAGVYLSEKPH